MTTDTPIRLSQLSHGGGCGCKLAPSVLRELLAGQPVAQAFPDLLVGTETADDAAVYRVSDDLAVIAEIGTLCSRAAALILSSTSVMLRA